MSPFWRSFRLGFILAHVGIAVGILLYCSARIAGADDGAIDRNTEYSVQHHDGVGGSTDGRIIYDLWERITEPNIPAAMVPGTVAVIQCESRWDTTVVGAAGERGVLQIHPIHRGAMAAVGLDYESEHDRIIWAVRLWQRRGWSPTWSCAP